MLKKLSDGVYLKQDKDNYSIVKPIRKDLDKPFSSSNIHWKNLLIGGSWGSLFKTMLILAIILFGVWSYSYDTAQCREIIEEPCGYCCGYCTCKEEVRGIGGLYRFNGTIQTK